MNSNMPVSEFAKLLPDLLKDGKTVSFCPKGKSMLPTIKEGDKVVLKAFDKPSKYDILFFITDDGKAILHRLVKIQKDGSYVMQGDSQAVKEIGITDKNIVARVIYIIKNKRKIKTTGLIFRIKSFVILNLKYIKRRFL